MGPVTTDMESLSPQIDAYVESLQPIWHTPINLGIKRLKRELREVHQGMSKSKLNLIIKAYKKRAWMEYQAVGRHRGTYPTHPHYGAKQEVQGETETTTIKVKNGKQQK